MIDSGNDLSATIEALYLVFAKYDRGKAQALCVSCGDAKELRDVNERLRVPLRELRDDIELVNYGWHGYGGGESERLRHFLPRILELAVDDDAGTTRVALDRLAMDLNDLHWRLWPAEEVDALERFFAAWIFHAFRSRAAAKRVVHFVAEIGADLEPLVEACASFARTAHAVDVAGWLLGDLVPSPVPVDTRERIMRRAHDEHVGARLEVAFFEEKEPWRQKLLSDAIEALRCFD